MFQISYCLALDFFPERGFCRIEGEKMLCDPSFFIAFFVTPPATLKPKAEKKFEDLKTALMEKRASDDDDL